MNIHEFQAKELFEKFGVATPKGTAARSVDELEPALSRIDGDGVIVVKAQIHAGGRGKGTFIDGFKGGVKLTKSRDEALDNARRMLGNTLVTAQTGPAGRKVQTVYFTEGCAIEKEYYLAVLLDRTTSRPVIIASTEGGVEIEAVAEKTPEKIFKVFVDPAVGLMPYQVRRLAFKLGFSGDTFKHAVKLIDALYRMWWDTDASMVEVNPLVATADEKVLALDAKVSFDDNALFRQPDIVAMRDLNEEDPKEIEASTHHLSYIALEGDIACLVNGAGLAMATMDIIKHYGGEPANFLDVGGGASKEQVTAAFRIILQDPNVKGILVNIFGGIMDCDTIAHGVIEATRELNLSMPLVVRLEGNNVEAGKKTLDSSGLQIISASTMADAAEKIVAAVKNG